jgi:hypothetical protein
MAGGLSAMQACLCGLRPFLGDLVEEGLKTLANVADGNELKDGDHHRSRQCARLC